MTIREERRMAEAAIKEHGEKAPELLAAVATSAEDEAQAACRRARSYPDAARLLWEKAELHRRAVREAVIILSDSSEKALRFLGDDAQADAVRQAWTAGS